jgi:hypothetical protein
VTWFTGRKCRWRTIERKVLHESATRLVSADAGLILELAVNDLCEDGALRHYVVGHHLNTWALRDILPGVPDELRHQDEGDLDTVHGGGEVRLHHWIVSHGVGPDDGEVVEVYILLVQIRHPLLAQRLLVLRAEPLRLAVWRCDLAVAKRTVTLT